MLDSLWVWVINAPYVQQFSLFDDAGEFPAWRSGGAARSGRTFANINDDPNPIAIRCLLVEAMYAIAMSNTTSSIVSSARDTPKTL
jgi:hypothetical protein